MEEKRKEPKKIKMPPLVDRSNEYDTLSFDNDDTLPDSHIKTFWKTYTIDNENHTQDNSQSVQ